MDGPSTSGSLPDADRVLEALTASGQLEKLRTSALQRLEQDVSLWGEPAPALCLCCLKPAAVLARHCCVLHAAAAAMRRRRHQPPPPPLAYPTCPALLSGHRRSCGAR